MRRRRSVKSMCRTYANAGHWPEKTQPIGRGLQIARAFAVCGVLAVLAACGSAPSLPEEKSEPVAGGAPTAGSVEAPKTNKPAKAAKAGKGAAATPVEEVIPPEATQQFEGAVALMGSGNAAGAEQAFRSLSAAYPKYSGALLNLGILQTKAGKFDEAEKTLQGAIERNAANAAAFNQLGIVYRRLGRFKEADEAYQQALQIAPDYAIAYLNLGVLCDLYLQQPQRALEAYERYLQLATAPDAKVNGWVSELKARLGSAQRSARTQS